MKGRVIAKDKKDFDLNKELIKKAQQGDENAKTDIILLNAGMVEKLTRMYMGNKDDYDDISQIANLALLKAVDRFDLTKDNKFSSFAYICIRGEILNYFRSNSTVKKKRTSNHLFNKIQKFKFEYYSIYGYYPSYEIIADELCEKVEEIKSTIVENQSVVSISSVNTDNEDNSSAYENILSNNEDPYETILLTDVIKNNLTEEETLIFNYNLNGFARGEIANIIGVSEGKIRYVLKRITEKLTKVLASDY